MVELCYLDHNFLHLHDKNTHAAVKCAEFVYAVGQGFQNQVVRRMVAVFDIGGEIE